VTDSIGQEEIRLVGGQKRYGSQEGMTRGWEGDERRNKHNPHPLAHLSGLPLTAPRVYPSTYLSQFLKPSLDLCKCGPLHLVNGCTIDDRLDKVLRVVYFICILPRSLTGILMFSSPVLFEVPLTATRPGTTPEWAINRMRKVRLEVSVSLSPTAK
jgi:hypothetical protein